MEDKISQLPKQPNLINVLNDFEKEIKELKRKIVQTSSATGTGGGGTSGPPLSTSNPTSIAPGVSASIGTSTSAAKSDHVHNITTAAPTSSLTATTTNSEGTASSVSRSDHVHAINTAAPTTDLSASTSNQTGTNTNLARSDHSHAITTGSPTSNLTATTSNSTGSASTLARSDHSHAITTGAPTANLTANTTNSTGTSSSISRADHSHAISTAAATSIAGLISLEGTSSSLARADHTHEITSVRCILERTTPQSLATGSTTDITFPTELFDLYGFHATNAAAITIPSINYAGIYIITATISFAGNTTNIRWLTINKNGSSTNMGSNTNANSGGGVTRLSVSAIMTLGLNDSVNVTGLQNSGGNLNVEYAHFAVARLGSI